MDRVFDLQKKEVINLTDGKRLGFLYDVEIDLKTGRIGSIIVPGEGKFLGLFGKDEEYIISFSQIKKVGDDIILVEL
jgi:YlmC/YmxH family sporulation protein